MVSAMHLNQYNQILIKKKSQVSAKENICDEISQTVMLLTSITATSCGLGAFTALISALFSNGGPQQLFNSWLSAVTGL